MPAYRAGMAHLEAGRLDAAIASLKEAHRRAPRDVGVLFALSVAARRLGLTGTAKRLCLQVLELEPDRLEALVTLANLHRAEGEAAAAIGLLKPAIERAPATPELWLTIGHAVRETGDRTAARSFYEEAARLKPSYAEALGSLADLAADSRDHESALALYDRAVRHAKENAQLRLNRAVLLLHMGRLEEGWRDYDWRLKLPSKAIRWRHGLPRWDGRIHEKVRLLVTAEQGIGDELLFASLLPELEERLADAKGRLLVACAPRLVPLFARSFPTASVGPYEVRETGGQVEGACGWLAPGTASHAIEMGSLPRLLRPSLADFPNPHAYLAADAEERARWRAWLESLGPGPYVGLCWRSGKTGGLRAQQFAPPELWAGAMAARGACYVALQYDADEAECDALAALAGVPLHRPPGIDQKQELDRATGLVAALDRVVSAPTAVACLAGGLGVPTAKVLFDKSWTALGQPFEPFQPACRVAGPAWTGDFADALSRAFAALPPRADAPPVPAKAG
ncbi:MAG: tetratricopeptide repeat protein [Alphaproteobacteria bacterium]|nr:tetratricopeptide repeat protein [Alphaproteobacteria bacterium]